jgi:hypothetical protein
MGVLLNLSIEPARRLFEVTVVGNGGTVRRTLQVLADTPQGAARIVRQRYPQARTMDVRRCTEPPPPAVD